MNGERPRYLVVGRLKKAHGLQGECTVFPLTDEPSQVFAPGASVWIMDMAGEVMAGPAIVERSRSHHRKWLLAFEGHTSREAVEPWRGHFLGVPADRLQPPGEGEVYVHELEGFAVVDENGDALGLVSGVYDLPSGLMIEVQGPKREVLVPFRKEFVTKVDRPARRLTVQLPDGL